MKTGRQRGQTFFEREQLNFSALFFEAFFPWFAEWAGDTEHGRGLNEPRCGYFDP